MLALVTGGGGFVGGWIVRKLLARGDRVRVIGRREYPELDKIGVETVRGDLTNAAAVNAAATGCEAIFHTAALTGIWGRPADFHAANVVGTENVVAACVANGVAKLVYTSTPSVAYGSTPIKNGDERLPYPANYLCAYARTKAVAEKTVIAANGTRGLLTCALRPHLVWGPGDTNLIPRIVARAESGRLAVVGDGRNLISVTYVENAADAHLAACDRLVPGGPAAGSCYFINENEPQNCWEFIGRLLAALGAPPVGKKIGRKTAYAVGAVFETVFGALGIRREPPMTRFLALQLSTDHYFSVEKARRELGWQSAVTIDEGLARLAASCRPGSR